jgi:hypothetical protein
MLVLHGPLLGGLCVLLGPLLVLLGFLEVYHGHLGIHVAGLPRLCMFLADVGLLELLELLELLSMFFLL